MESSKSGYPRSDPILEERLAPMPHLLAAARSHLAERTALWPVLILRFMIGINFMMTSRSWIREGDRGASLIDQMAPRLEAGRTVEFFEPFLRGVVFEHAEVFATLVTIGESVVAVTMLLGLTTRLGAAVGMFLLANYALGSGNSFWVPTGNWMWFWQLAVVFFAAPGRIFGLDVFLRKRWPKVPLW